MNLRHKLLGSVAAVALMTGTAGWLATPAGADPVNAKKGETLPVVCDQLGNLTIASNGNGEWTPGLVIDGNRVLKPYEFHTTGSFTPAGGGETETFTEDFVKPAPRNGRYDTCTFSGGGSDENGTFVFEGTVKLSYTPKG